MEVISYTVTLRMFLYVFACFLYSRGGGRRTCRKGRGGVGHKTVGEGQNGMAVGSFRPRNKDVRRLSCKSDTGTFHDTKKILLLLNLKRNTHSRYVSTYIIHCQGK